METLSPVSTSNLVETFSDWAGTVGSGVGVGEGVGVGLSVGVGDGAETVTEPTIPIKACGVQKYGNEPAAGKVWEKVAPWFRIPESQNPLGLPGVPDVLLWPLALQVHSTVSPTSIVTEVGKKEKPSAPTVTVVVAAPACLGQSARRSPINKVAPTLLNEKVVVFTSLEFVAKLSIVISP
jgi:hypothetical protein